MIDFANLKKMPQDQLKLLARQQGVVFRGNPSVDTLVQKIIAHVNDPTAQIQKKAREMQHPSQVAEKKEIKWNTPEEIREAIKKQLDKDGFQALFTDETWHFKFRGAEDTGHLSVPLRVIKMKAENVSYGARALPTVNFDGERIMSV